MDRSALDRSSRQCCRSGLCVPKAELLAKCGQAQERAIDFYDVVYATRRVAVPANELRFPTANGAPSIPSFLLVRARHVFAPALQDDVNAHRDGRSIGPAYGGPACLLSSLPERRLRPPNQDWERSECRLLSKPSSRLNPLRPEGAVPDEDHSCG